MPPIAPAHSAHLLADLYQFQCVGVALVVQPNHALAGTQPQHAAHLARGVVGEHHRLGGQGLRGQEEAVHGAATPRPR